MPQSRGFTLIELLVVIAIIGILSGIVLVNLRSSQVKARDAKRLSDIQSLVTALGVYYSDNKVYPTTLAGLVAGGQLQSVPVDPSDSTATPRSYVYAAIGSGTDCNGYHVGAILENMTSDAIGNDSDALAGTVCTDGGTDFAGADTGDTPCGVTATGACYDIKQ